ncbi:ATPase, T2SS/T4P/T4SS family [Castellaniella sp.]|uniref:ATPase, T2SS/T4P/T4SS family n=1 Tax=Castellaniella sp. TaxID=1955812 RepID=UPI0035611353
MKAWPALALFLSENQRPFDPARAGTVAHAADLAALRPAIRRLLHREHGVEQLAERLCPVERDDDTVTILAHPDHVGSDQADALERSLVSRGCRLSEPSRFILPAPLLLALARKGLQRMAPVAGSERTPTALAGVFQDLVEWGVRHQATDLHLNILKDAEESEVRYTVMGRYVAPEPFRQLPTALLLDVLSVAWMDIQGGNGAVFDPLREQQGMLVRQVDGCSYVLRWASLAAERGPSVCLRFLARDAADQVVSLASLGYRADQIACFDRVMRSEGGAVILAGAVGSGKSTTLATLIRRLPEDRKIITLEEPVEYRIRGAVQNSLGRNLDQDAREQYAAKLRTLKRSAMTDVLLGEIRDKDSARAFMDLVGSGVNLYTTVHASCAQTIIDRLASDFIAIPRDFLLAPGMLKLMVHQVLLPQLCAACARPLSVPELVRQQLRGPSAAYWQQWLGWVQRLWALDMAGIRLRNPQGCATCRAGALPELYGYSGRTVAAEFLEPGLASADPGDGVAHVPHRVCSAMAHAMQKVAQGGVDPRDVEPRFMAFETMMLRLGLPCATGAP